MSIKKFMLLVIVVTLLSLFTATGVSHAKTSSTNPSDETTQSSTTSATSSEPSIGPSSQCLESDCGGCHPLTHCRPCLGYEKKSANDKLCKSTGFKHRALCIKSKKKIFTPCDPASENTHTDKIKFWVFEVFALCGLVVGQLVAIKRQKKHEERALKRIQKQIEA